MDRKEKIKSIFKGLREKRYTLDEAHIKVLEVVDHAMQDLKDITSKINLEDRFNEGPKVEYLFKPITDLDCSPYNLRIHTALHEYGIETVGDLIQKTEKDLLKCNDIKQPSVRMLKAALAKLGLDLVPLVKKKNTLKKEKHVCHLCGN